MRQRAVIAVLLVAAVALLVAVLSGGSNEYKVRLQLSDAQGLRDGARVVIGGVQVGTVNLRLSHGTRVITTLDVDRQHAPVGRDASAMITAVNLLGQKEVELDPGTRSHPAPSGWTIPAARITPSTDLDQVLDVLGPDTRARLSVLINELGAAVTGRRADFSALLQELPTSLSQGTMLLGRLVADHGTLGDLVAKSDRFVTILAQQRQALGRLVGGFSRTADVVSTRDAELGRMLSELPGTLISARAFLDKLRLTTVPLGPAAADIERTAPSLTAVLGEIAPFTAAARPTLAQATAVAPDLTSLADGATPVLAHARTPLATLAKVSSDLVPVTDTLRHSADNLIGIPTNWAHAIELRDGLSHVFRAEVTVTPQSLKWMVDRLLNTSSSQAAASGDQSHRAAPPASRPTPAGPAGQPGAGQPGRAPGASSGGGASGLLPGVLNGVGGVLAGVLHGTHLLPGAAPTPPAPTPPASSRHGGILPLLNYLLKP